MIQKSLVLIKPDGVERGLIGEIIKRFEQRGLKIVGMKMVWVDKDFAKEHYSEHVNKPFFNELLTMITEGPIVAIALEGRNAIKVVRKIVGSTRPDEALPGTIRGDFAHSLIEGRNLVHASANESDAEKELRLWFKEDELKEYERSDEKHVIGKR